MESNNGKQNTERSIQDYLSLGYIYLLLLGICRELIFYGMMDINIFSYSSVLDVMLSPLIVLGSKLKVVFGLFSFSLILYFVGSKLNKKKLEDDSLTDDEKMKIRNQSTAGSIFLVGIGIFAFFIGTGIGGGIKYGNKLKKGEFEASHQITFLPEKEVEVKLIGSNSQYIFYVLENDNEVSISPIQGNVKTIKKLPKEE